jgi:hypothetical protein
MTLVSGQTIEATSIYRQYSDPVLRCGLEEIFGPGIHASGIDIDFVDALGVLPHAA